MPEMSAIEHLKIAKRLHFQGLTDDAVREYEAVLSIDPDNSDAIAGLRALGVEPTVREDGEGSALGHAGGLKTNFFSNQSKPESGGVQGFLFKLFVFGLAISSCYGLYVLVTYLLNYQNVEGRENVIVEFERPRIKDNIAVVNVAIRNLNPAPIRHMKVAYTIKDPSDTTLKEGMVELAGQVPAGDRRTFDAVTLGEVKGVPAKLSPRLEGLVYTKPKVKERIASKFMKAAELRDREAYEDYDVLCQETDDFAPAWVGRGRSLAARGHFKEAMESYEKALEIEPLNANGHYYKAVALWYEGDKQKDLKLKQEAMKEIDKAMEIAPDDPEIEYNKKYMTNLYKGAERKLQAAGDKSKAGAAQDEASKKDGAKQSKQK